MAEQYQLYLIGGEDDEQAIFDLSEDGDICRIGCSYRDKTLRSDSTDFFEALCDIRNQLARDQLIPFCYGASLNVFPSGMARAMGGGLKAYKLTNGQPARTADLVDIFAEGHDIIPSTTAMQKGYFDDWLASLAMPRD